MKNMLIILFVLFFFFNSADVTAQDVQEQEEAQLSDYVPGDLIDLPVSSVLLHGEYAMGLRIYPNGGVLSSFAVGMLDRIQATVYYGGENLIGEGDVNWNPRIGVDARVRVLEESALTPAISVGLSTQGYGGYVDSTNRYMRKSKGFYIVGSRNYFTLVGDLSVHGGINFSLEREDEDKDLSFFFGTSLALWTYGEAILEYDFAINDNEDFSIGKDSGYLNLGVRFYVSDHFKLSFHLTNLFENTKDDRGFGREIKIEFRDIFRK
ncbi:MAG: YjbH domain-containing protein [bacterium]|nr:YjbH domain-containing protein [bacterium]